MCRKQHTCGQQALASKLPRRVLDVTEAQGSQFVKLMETNDEFEGEYATLSHCWGQPATVLETTSSSFPHRLHSIKIAELPPTFRDAVLLTRHLGLRYLWMDSLCIIQDDRLDWEIESSQMADIYSNCTLCISATSSADSNGGCLFDRWTEQSLSPTSKIPMVAARFLVQLAIYSARSSSAPSRMPPIPSSSQNIMTSTLCPLS
jgi:Heterokaryon incompatibility protein (HET)